MFADQINDIIRCLEDKKEILISTHNMVDLDGFSSCFALKHLLNSIFNEKSIDILFLELSKQTSSYMYKFSSKFAEINFNFKSMDNVNLNSYDAIILLDVNEISSIFSQEGDTNANDIPQIIIDHHYDNNDRSGIATTSLISDETTSTAELIYEFFVNTNEPLTIEMKYLLLSGILTDTGHFKYANNISMQRVSKLLEGLDNDAFQEILELIKTSKDLSEKIAIIKGFQRVELHRYNDWLIGISHVSSYEGMVASKLVKSGFDVSIVYSQGKDDNRISTRANNRICSETGLHLGKLINEYVKGMNANGGGHDGAAGLNGSFNAKDASMDLLNKIKEILNN